MSTQQMTRYNLYITDRQREQLSKEAEEKNLTVSELIRRILDKHIDNKK